MRKSPLRPRPWTATTNLLLEGGVRWSASPVPGLVRPRGGPAAMDTAYLAMRTACTKLVLRPAVQYGWITGYTDGFPAPFRRPRPWRIPSTPLWEATNAHSASVRGERPGTDWFRGKAGFSGTAFPPPRIRSRGRSRPALLTSEGAWVLAPPGWTPQPLSRVPSWRKPRHTRGPRGPICCVAASRGGGPEGHPPGRQWAFDFTRTGYAVPGGNRREQRGCCPAASYTFGCPGRLKDTNNNNGRQRIPSPTAP